MLRTTQPGYSFLAFYLFHSKPRAGWLRAMICKARERVARERTPLYVTEPRGDAQHCQIAPSASLIKHEKRRKHSFPALFASKEFDAAADRYLLFLR